MGHNEIRLLVVCPGNSKQLLGELKDFNQLVFFKTRQYHLEINTSISFLVV